MKISLALISIFLYFQIYSQTISNQSTIGGAGTDGLTSSAQLDSNNFILVGYSDSHISGNKTSPNYGSLDYWFIKMDSSLNVLWQKNFGGSGGDNPSSIIYTQDGNILCAGFSNSMIGGNKTADNKGSSDFWLIKMDQQGNEIWQKTMGGDGGDAYPIIQETRDGDLIIAGISSSKDTLDKSDTSRGGGDYWLIKADSNGNIIWDKTIGGNNGESAIDLVLTENNQIIIAGVSNSDISGEKSDSCIKTIHNSNTDDLWIVMADSSGNILWDKTFGGNEFERGAKVEIINNKIFIATTTKSDISGNKTSANKGREDIWLICLDMNGNKIWEKNIGGNLGDWLGGISVTSQDHLLITAFSTSNISGDKTENQNGGGDYWILNLDTNGITNWQKTVGGNGIEIAVGSFVNVNDKVILTGYSDSKLGADKNENSRGLMDYWIVELDVPTITGIKDHKYESQIKLYPNPVQNILHLDFDGEEVTSLHAKVMDAAGKVILKKLIDNSKEVDVSTFAPGLYFIELHLGDQSIISKFVVQ